MTVGSGSEGAFANDLSTTNDQRPRVSLLVVTDRADRAVLRRASVQPEARLRRDVFFDGRNFDEAWEQACSDSFRFT